MSTALMPEGAKAPHYVRLRLYPVSQDVARRFIAEVHRHNDPPHSQRVTVGIKDDAGTLRGVGMLSRPVARMLDDGTTAEIVRVATDGVPNGASMLYGALLRAAWAIGYDRVYTYTLEDEPGTSLRAAGWRHDGLTPDRAWDKGVAWDSRPGRSDSRPTLFFEAKAPHGRKNRWVIERKDRRSVA